MDLLALWGWLAAATGMICGLPQIIRLLKVRTSAGVSTGIIALINLAYWTSRHLTRRDTAEMVTIAG